MTRVALYARVSTLDKGQDRMPTQTYDATQMAAWYT